jgi:hypothetical protein
VTPRRAVLLAGVLAVVVSAVAPSLGQQQPGKLIPESPPDGASAGKKPRFVIRASGPAVDKLRFRIELSTNGFETIAYRFDQAKDANGWAYTSFDDGAPGAVFFTRQPIAGGDYEWRVASWDGLSWSPGDASYRIRIDDVPPADVDGVRMWRDARTGCVRLSWAPVVTDAEGNPERVGSYHVYRYASKGPTRPVRPFEVGTTAALELDDCDLDAQKAPILFYRVVAHDEAGNVPGRKF